MKALSLLALALSCASPALASVTVTSPANGSTVTSPFTLLATATPCSAQSVSTMGFSFDDSSSTTTANGASFAATVTLSLGNHVLHVKSWGSKGASCKTDVTVTVVQGSQAAGSDLVVSSPVNSASVTTPFVLSARGTQCSGQSIASLGYSLDTSSATKTVNGQSISATVASSAGSHTLHVKAWGTAGASCVTSVALTVTVPVNGPSIPPTAQATNLIQNLTTWTHEHDPGTRGTSTGAMSLVTTPAVSGSARQFVTTYTNYGGERYNVDLLPDQVSMNFVYDAQIYIANASTDIANIEMDVNQVMANGQTAIFGFQCDGWSHTWDYTANTGTPTSPSDHWLHSTQSCNPQQWATNTWHHIQVQYSRDGSGNVTYKAVWLDGVEQDINVTVLSAFALGWGPTLNSNFQIDGCNSTSGSATIYVDKLTLYRW